MIPAPLAAMQLRSKGVFFPLFPQTNFGHYDKIVVLFLLHKSTAAVFKMPLGYLDNILM